MTYDTEAAQQTSFDLTVLAVTIVILIFNILGLVTLLKLIFQRKADAVTNVFTAQAVADVVHLLCIIVYTHLASYKFPSLNWIATMVIAYSNWCYLPMLLCVFTQVHPTSWLCRVCTVGRIRIALIVLLGLACIPSIPGYLETSIYTNPVCMNAKTMESCVPRFRSIIRLQLLVVPGVVHLLPVITAISFLLITVNHYKPDGIKRVADDKAADFRETAIQAMLSGIIFTVCYCPTILLIVVVSGDDTTRAAYENDFKQLKGARGIMKLALVFRIVKIWLNLVISFISNGEFRSTLISIFCCQKSQEKQKVRHRHKDSSSRQQ